MKKLFLHSCIISFYILFNAALLYALGDGSSCSVDMPAASGFINLQEEMGGRSFILTTGIEHIFKKSLDDDGSAVSGKIEGDWLLLGLGHRVANKFEPYLRLGTLGMDISWTENGDDIELNSDPEFAIGAGFKMLAYKAKLTSLCQVKVNLDGQVRYSNPSVKKVTIDKTSRTVSAEELEIFESRVAATLGFEISLKKLFEAEEEEIKFYLVPYFGAGYTNSVVTAKFDYEGTRYGYNDTHGSKNINLIAGLDIVAPQYVLLNVESSFFGDESVSGGVNIKF